MVTRHKYRIVAAWYLYANLRPLTDKPFEFGSKEDASVLVFSTVN